MLTGLKLLVTVVIIYVVYSISKPLGKLMEVTEELDDTIVGVEINKIKETIKEIRNDQED